MSTKNFTVAIVIAAIIVCLVGGCGDDGSATFTGSTGPAGSAGVTGNPGSTGGTGSPGIGYTPAPVPTPSDTTATISGILYVNSSPAGAGYNVRLTPVISDIGSSESYGEQQTVITDGNGFYSFTVSFAGNYVIEGLTPDNSSLLDSQYCYITPGINMTVNLGTLPVPVPTPSADKVTIAGLVYDETGKAAGSGYSVTLTPVMDGSGIGSQESYGEVQNTTTDTDSEFTFTVSFSGNYLLEVWTSDRTKVLGSAGVNIPASSFGSTFNIVIKITRPHLAGIVDVDGNDRDPDYNVTSVTFTLPGFDFGTTQGSVRFINQSDSSEISALIASWSDTEITGTVNIGDGKYLIRVTAAYGLDSTEDVYYRKGLRWRYVGDLSSTSSVRKTATSLCVYDGIPYVVYDSLLDSWNRVLKYEGDSWQQVGGDVAVTQFDSFQGFVHLRSTPSLFVCNSSIIYMSCFDFFGTVNVFKYDKLNVIYPWQSVPYVAGNLPYQPVVPAPIGYPSLFAYNYTPYVAFPNSSGKATVKRFISAWEDVGTPGFSAGSANYISLYIYDDGIVYVAYSDGNASDKVTVMKYEEGGSWQPVGSPGFSTGNAMDISLYVCNGFPYVAYKDGALSDKAVVMKYTGALWEAVGESTGFSSGAASSISLQVYDDKPYVAYIDGAESNNATVMKYDGSSWQSLGGAGFSGCSICSPSLSVYNGVPYIAFLDANPYIQVKVMKYEYLP